MPLVLFVLELSETVLVLEGTCWGVVDLRPKYWGSSFLKKTIALNRFKRFEYEKTELRSTKTPELPFFMN